MRSRLLTICLFISILAGCGGVHKGTTFGIDASVDVGEVSIDVAADGAIDSEGVEHPSERDYLPTLNTPDDYATMASSGEVKYLAIVKDSDGELPDRTACIFQNTRRYSWHLEFLRSLPMFAGLSFNGYTALVTRKGSRQLWAGALKTWPAVIHPITQQMGIIGYSIYGESGSVDPVAIAEVYEKLAACAPFASGLLVFVPDTPELESLVRQYGQELVAAGIPCLLPSDLTVNAAFVPNAQGEGYGTLRIVPKGTPLGDYGPRDVVVVESAPNDISIVAGLITKNPQNELGHVNLRLGEKHIPNATVPGIYNGSWAETLDGYLVHMVVTTEKFVLEPATLSDAEAFWSSHRPQVRAPVANLSVVSLTSFADLRAQNADAFGVKSANLAELVHVLAPTNRNDGFAIPFARYQAFMQDSGLATIVNDVAVDARMRTDTAYKQTRLKDLRRRIKDTSFPPALLADLANAIRSTLGESALGQRLRFRSSTNVEDLDAFTGAGLYESKTGCYLDEADGDAAGPSLCLGLEEKADLESELAARQAEFAAYPERTWLAAIIDDLRSDLTEEKTLSNAVRKVWASLWNERAFDEREYYGIDHRLAEIGIAVTISFTRERASAVAVTNLQVDEGLPLYRLNSQAGTESVVQPEDPTAIAELLTFRRSGEPPVATDIRILLYSNRVPEGAMVWPDSALQEVSHVLFVLQDHFAAQVYPSARPLRLDVELKLTHENDVVVKQVRPYVNQGDEP
jgi:pyruvate,water dikinase